MNSRASCELMYEVVFTKKGSDTFASLDSTIKERIIDVLERIKINPRRYLRKLAGTDFFRLRVGDYRVILHIDETNKTLVVLGIGHRKNIYG